MNIFVAKHYGDCFGIINSKSPFYELILSETDLLLELDLYLYHVVVAGVKRCIIGN